MVQKLYGGAKFLVWSGLVDAYAQVLCTDAKIRADEHGKNCPCNAIVIQENDRERGFVLEALEVLGKTFGIKTFNRESLEKAARERMSRGC